MTNTKKAEAIGILDILLQNYTLDQIDQMSAKQILDARLKWEGIYGQTKMIIEIIDTFFKPTEP
jgi:hypothetical protein